MPLQISYEVSDRSEMEGIPGLQAEILFRRSDEDQASRLVGTAEITAQLELGAISISVDDLALRDCGRQLLRVIFNVGLRSSVTVEVAAVGLYWCDFYRWLFKHVSPAQAVSILFGVEAAAGYPSLIRNAQPSTSTETI